MSYPVTIIDCDGALCAVHFAGRLTGWVEALDPASTEDGDVWRACTVKGRLQRVRSLECAIAILVEEIECKIQSSRRLPS